MHFVKFPLVNDQNQNHIHVPVMVSMTLTVHTVIHPIILMLTAADRGHDQNQVQVQCSDGDTWMDVELIWCQVLQNSDVLFMCLSAVLMKF